ncbi:MAG: hemerythrin domain-containing protein, partial [Ilumatobacteraceae bacterium]
MDDTTMTATALLRNRHREVTAMFEQLLHSAGPERRELFDCLRAMLAVHETAEEVVVHPKVRGFDEAGMRAVEARLEEEQEAKRVLSELEAMDCDDPAFLPRVAVFREAVVTHAEAEEREIFPRIEQRCSPEEQRTMAQRIQLAEKMAPTHPHPHGPSSAVGN